MQLLNLVLFYVYFVVYVTCDPYSNGAWRTSLDGAKSCWTDRGCSRVMSTAHGGEWNITFPYDSLPAFMQAFDDGADAVKGDFRVSKDNIGMVMHSSPIEIYESLNCHGKRVEEMTAEECTKCQMEITTYTFITVPELLQWADNKVNVMFCVKESEDIPRAISSLIENNATHRSFLEVSIRDIQLQETNGTPGWDQVYYVVNMKSKDDLQSVFASSATVQSRGFLLEFNNWEDWEDLEDDVTAAKSKGFRTFAATRSNAITATVENHLRIYNAGIDVTYTYNLTNAVIARKQVNAKNHITPP